MALTDKSLHSSEQSMLLVAMLFDGKNLNDLLRLLPEQQSARMHKANEKFLKMPRNERMTEIVLELRRMLLVDEHRIDYIHQTWIGNAEAEEPPYLRPFIDKALKHGAQKKNDDTPRSFVPLPVIFSMFIDQLLNTQQKTAIYDPVLMRLQSLKDEAQEEVFKALGLWSLSSLQENIMKPRLKKFLAERGMTLELLPLANIKEKPWNDISLRRCYVRELARFRPNETTLFLEFAGLLTTALYLLPFKYHWQRSITLGLHRNLGLIVNAILQRRAGFAVDKAAHQNLANLIIFSQETRPTISALSNAQG